MFLLKQIYLSILHLQVQSQDIALNFLARLVFAQQQIGPAFLDRREVVDMLRCGSYC